MKIKNPFKKDKNESLSGNIVNINIYRLMSDRTPIQIAEFPALQTKDENYNINLENPDANFKEELGIQRDKIIDYLVYKLELNKLKYDDKIKKVKEKINSIESDIKNLKDGEINGVQINSVDLDVELQQYKVLKYTIENSGDGSFEIINKNNTRELHLLYQDGILIPYFWRSTKSEDSILTIYPEIASKRKFYKQEQDIINEERLSEQSNFFSGIKGLIITIAITLLIIGNLIWASRNFENANTLDDKIAEYRDKCDKSAVDCSFYFSKMIELELINKTINISKVASKEEKPTTSPIVNLLN